MDCRKRKRFHLPGKFYKRSQGKKTSPSAGVFLAVQPASLSKIAVACRSVISGRCFIHAALLVFSASGFRHFAATKPVSSETHKQHGCQLPTMVLLGTLGPSLFRVVRGGLGSRERLGVPRHAGPNLSAETRP